MPARILAGAMCVQRFDDSLNSAIHITYRISLRSSSMPEPRDPLLKVLIHFRNAYERRREGSDYKKTREGVYNKSFGWSSGGRLGPGLRRARGRESRRGNRLVTFTLGLGVVNSVMIPPLVHQRRPCYDFYFL